MRRYFAHVQLLLQNDHSSHKTRQRMDLPLRRPWTAANLELHISWVLERRVFHLLSPPSQLARLQLSERGSICRPPPRGRSRYSSTLQPSGPGYQLPGSGRAGCRARGIALPRKFVQERQQYQQLHRAQSEYLVWHNTFWGSPLGDVLCV